ncbi:MAG: phosphate/phosphite/phosphonate ABC transporter substrate-binding protein [Sulfurimonas sp.]|jgi:phosphonate transport system substrate-binding protein
MKNIVNILILVGLLVYSSFAAERYSVAVVPQMQTIYIQKTWGSFLKELSGRTGFEFELRHYATIPLFEQALEEGTPDIAFMNPYHAVMAYDWQKYKPIVHDQKSLVGILVVKKNGAIHKLSDLKGMQIGFPAPNAFAASLYMRALLEQEEGLSFKPVYLKTHTNVYRNVMFGQIGAGGGVNNTLMREDDAVRSQLEVIYTTKPTAPHPLCVHPRMSKKAVQSIETAIFDLAKDPKYKEILDDIQLPTPVKADYVKEYLPLKKLKLEKYIVNDD